MFNLIQLNVLNVAMLLSRQENVKNEHYFVKNDEFNAPL